MASASGSPASSTRCGSRTSAAWRRPARSSVGSSRMRRCRRASRSRSSRRTGACASGRARVAVAVRSSATAEDLPEASFAGQHESFLGVRGEAAVLGAVRRCLASIFTDRAIVYRIQNGFDHLAVRLSVAVQRMVDAGGASSGVMFTLDPETGFPDVVLDQWRLRPRGGRRAGAARSRRVLHLQADASQRPRPMLKRTIVRKPGSSSWGARRQPAAHRGAGRRAAHASLTDAEALELGAFALAIEAHYSTAAGTPVPMDIEWAKDAADGRLYILQARPETVHRGRAAGRHRGLLARAGPAARAARPRAWRSASGSGRARRGRCATRSDSGSFRAGEVLVGGDDGSRLGADHEARGGHRDRSRRPHLPRRHREPRARRAVRRRHRERHRAAAGRRRWSRSRAPRARAGPCTAGPCRSSGGGRSRGLPTRRTKVMLNVGNPGRGVSAGRAARTTASGWPGSSSSSAARPRAPDGAAPSGARGRPGRARRDRRADARLRRARRVLRRPPRRGGGRHRRRLLPEGRDRPPLGLQDERVRGAGRRARLRAGGGATRCSAFAERSATPIRNTARRSRSSAEPCGVCARTWASPTSSS